MVAYAAEKIFLALARRRTRHPKPERKPVEQWNNGYITLIQLFGQTVRLCDTNLFAACLAALVSERAGIFDIGLELAR